MRVLLSILFTVGCGVLPIDNRSRYKDLSAEVTKLQEALDLLRTFQESAFNSCSEELGPFEQKVCKIAQSSTAEQRLLMEGRLAEVIKIFQVELYGEDCLGEDSASCPAPGSLASKGDDFDSRLDELSSEMAALQARVINTESFQGILDSLGDQISALESRVASIEQEVSQGDWLRLGFLCGDNPESGPVYEAVLYDGGRQTLVGNKGHLETMAQVGDGDSYRHTHKNSKSCKYKVYDKGTNLQVCWVNDDRGAKEHEIDAACNNNSSKCSCL